MCIIGLFFMASCLAQPINPFNVHIFFNLLVLFLCSEWRVSPQPAQGPRRLVVHRCQLWYWLPVPAGRSENRPADARRPAHAQRPRHGPCWPGHGGSVSPRPALTTGVWMSWHQEGSVGLHLWGLKTERLAGARWWRPRQGRAVIPHRPTTIKPRKRAF